MDKPFVDRTNDRRVIPLLLLGLVLLFGTLYVASYVFTSDKVPRGTTVAGVAIGGLTPVAAQHQLDEGLRDSARKPIIVSAAGRRASLAPDESGLTVDVPASVARTGAGRSWSPSRMWAYFVGGRDFDAVVSVDQQKLDKAIATFAKQVDQPAREGSVTFAHGQATAHYPQTGEIVDRDAAVARVKAAFLKSDDVVPLPVRTVEPKISKRAVANAMDRFANPAMSGPVTLRLGQADVVLRPETYSSALAMRPSHGRLVPVLHASKLLAAIAPQMKAVTVPPTNATVKMVNGHRQVVPGRNGVTFDSKEITHRFLWLVVQPDERRTLKVKAVTVKPDVTTDEAKASGSGSGSRP